MLASPLGLSAARAVSSFVEEEEEDPGMGDIAVVGSRAGECRAWRPMVPVASLLWMFS